MGLCIRLRRNDGLQRAHRELRPSMHLSDFSSPAREAPLRAAHAQARSKLLKRIRRRIACASRNAHLVGWRLMSRRPHRLSDRIEPLLAVASRASRLCEARACRRVAAGLADGGRFDKGGVEHAAWGWSMPPAVAVVAFWALRLGLDVKLVEKLVEAQPIAESHLGVWGYDSTGEVRG